jgi:hypothetical protein
MQNANLSLRLFDGRGPRAFPLGPTPAGRATNKNIRGHHLHRPRAVIRRAAPPHGRRWFHGGLDKNGDGFISKAEVAAGTGDAACRRSVATLDKIRRRQARRSRATSIFYARQGARRPARARKAASAASGCPARAPAPPTATSMQEKDELAALPATKKPPPPRRGLFSFLCGCPPLPGAEPTTSRNTPRPPRSLFPAHRGGTSVMRKPSSSPSGPRRFHEGAVHPRLATCWMSKAVDTSCCSGTADLDPRSTSRGPNAVVQRAWCKWKVVGEAGFRSLPDPLAALSGNSTRGGRAFPRWGVVHGASVAYRDGLFRRRRRGTVVSRPLRPRVLCNRETRKAVEGQTACIAHGCCRRLRPPALQPRWRVSPGGTSLQLHDRLVHLVHASRLLAVTEASAG